MSPVLLRLSYAVLGGVVGVAVYLAFAPLPKFVYVAYCPAPVLV